MEGFTVEDFIPHRGRMKLVEEILEADEKMAKTACTVNEEWPLYENGSVSPIVLIELTAQTAGVSIGWEEMVKFNKKGAGKGWIVGVRKASFAVDSIPLNTRIVTEARELFSNGEYGEIEGRSSIGSEQISRVVLQVFKTTREFDFGAES